MKTFTQVTEKGQVVVVDELNLAQIQALRLYVGGNIIKYYHYYYQVNMYQLIVKMNEGKKPMAFNSLLAMIGMTRCPSPEVAEVTNQIVLQGDPHKLLKIFGGKIQKRWCEEGFIEELVVTLSPNQDRDKLIDAVIAINEAK